MSPEIIDFLIGISGVAIGAMITGLFQRKKIDAEALNDGASANEQIRKTVMELIEPTEKRITELKGQVRHLEHENGDLRKWAEQLVCQVKGLGAVPIPYKGIH